jgi:hypothetical protein
MCGSSARSWLAANAALPLDMEGRKALKRPAEQRLAVVEQPLPPPSPPLPPLTIPAASTGVLLERQIASCVGIIEYVAQYVGRNDTATDACANFMARIASLMNSSASVAKMVARYRGLKQAETCHRSIIERVDNRSSHPQGEGVLRA